MSGANIPLAANLMRGATHGEWGRFLAALHPNDLSKLAGALESWRLQINIDRKAGAK